VRTHGYAEQRILIHGSRDRQLNLTARLRHPADRAGRYWRACRIWRWPGCLPSLALAAAERPVLAGIRHLVTIQHVCLRAKWMERPAHLATSLPRRAEWRDRSLVVSWILSSAGECVAVSAMGRGGAVGQSLRTAFAGTLLRKAPSCTEVDGDAPVDPHRSVLLGLLDVSLAPWVTGASRARLGGRLLICLCSVAMLISPTGVAA
jgi:hypothetical protein